MNEISSFGSKSRGHTSAAFPQRQITSLGPRPDAWALEPYQSCLLLVVRSNQPLTKFDD